MQELCRLIGKVLILFCLLVAGVASASNASFNFTFTPVGVDHHLRELQATGVVDPQSNVLQINAIAKGFVKRPSDDDEQSNHRWNVASVSSPNVTHWNGHRYHPRDHLNGVGRPSIGDCPRTLHPPNGQKLEVYVQSLSLEDRVLRILELVGVEAFGVIPDEKLKELYMIRSTQAFMNGLEGVPHEADIVLNDIYIPSIFVKALKNEMSLDELHEMQHDENWMMNPDKPDEFLLRRMKLKQDNFDCWNCYDPFSCEEMRPMFSEHMTDLAVDDEISIHHSRVLSIRRTYINGRLKETCDGSELVLIHQKLIGELAVEATLLQIPPWRKHTEMRIIWLMDRDLVSASSNMTRKDKNLLTTHTVDESSGSERPIIPEEFGGGVFYWTGDFWKKERDPKDRKTSSGIGSIYGMLVWATYAIFLENMIIRSTWLIRGKRVEYIFLKLSECAVRFYDEVLKVSWIKKIDATLRIVAYGTYCQLIGAIILPDNGAIMNRPIGRYNLLKPTDFFLVGYKAPIINDSMKNVYDIRNFPRIKTLRSQFKGCPTFKYMFESIYRYSKKLLEPLDKAVAKLYLRFTVSMDHSVMELIKIITTLLSPRRGRDAEPRWEPFMRHSYAGDVTTSTPSAEALTKIMLNVVTNQHPQLLTEDGNEDGVVIDRKDQSSTSYVSISPLSLSSSLSSASTPASNGTRTKNNVIVSNDHHQGVTQPCLVKNVTLQPTVENIKVDNSVVTTIENGSKLQESVEGINLQELNCMSATSTNTLARTTKDVSIQVQEVLIEKFTTSATNDDNRHEGEGGSNLTDKSSLLVSQKELSVYQSEIITIDTEFASQEVSVISGSVSDVSKNDIYDILPPNNLDICRNCNLKLASSTEAISQPSQPPNDVDVDDGPCKSKPDELTLYGKESNNSQPSNLFIKPPSDPSATIVPSGETKFYPGDTSQTTTNTSINLPGNSNYLCNITGSQHYTVPPPPGLRRQISPPLPTVPMSQQQNQNSSSVGLSNPPLPPPPPNMFYPIYHPEVLLGMADHNLNSGIIDTNNIDNIILPHNNNTSNIFANPSGGGPSTSDVDPLNQQHLSYNKDNINAAAIRMTNLTQMNCQAPMMDFHNPNSHLLWTDLYGSNGNFNPQSGSLYPQHPMYNNMIGMNNTSIPLPPQQQQHHIVNGIGSGGNCYLPQQQPPQSMVMTGIPEMKTDECFYNPQLVQMSSCTTDNVINSPKSCNISGLNWDRGNSKSGQNKK